MRLLHRRPPREGFTTTELLVVIAIIAILAALTSAAVMKFRDRGPVYATRGTLKAAKSRVEAQWSAVRDAAQKETGVEYQTYAASMSGQPTDAVRRAYVQAKLRQAFPTTFAEALSSPGGGLQPLPAYQRFLGTGPGTGAHEGSVCVLMAVSVGPKSNAKAEDFATVKDFTLSNGRVVKGLADAWGNPLGFTRNANGVLLTSGGGDGNLATSNDNIDTTNP